MDQRAEISPDPATTPLSLRWIGRGLRSSISFAVLILALAFVGFGAFARDLGFPLWQIVVLAITTWALPSMVVFVTVMANEGSLVAAGIAVTLSAVRLLPMTVALMPSLATERARKIWFYLGSQFIAITIYVEAILRLPKVPPEVRLSFFLGFGCGLMAIATTGGAIGYTLAAEMPKPVLVGLLFLTPMYFLLSMLQAASTLSDRAALVLGCALGPVFAVLDPRFDLLWAGVIGGTLAYGLRRLTRRAAP